MQLIEITVTQLVTAPTEVVFDVWIDPKSPGCPWFRAERVVFNAVEEGLFWFTVQHEGRSWPHYGRFVRIDRPLCLKYTWMSEATKGVESLVTVTFEPKGDQTEVTLRHSDVPDDAMGRQHKDGWTWVLSTFAQRFAGKTP